MKKGRIIYLGDTLKKIQPKPVGRKEMILRTVAEYYDVDIFKDTRKREISFARFVAIFFLRKMKYSVGDIGDMFRRDHSISTHAVKVINNLCDYDPETRKQISDIETLLG